MDSVPAGATAVGDQQPRADRSDIGGPTAADGVAVAAAVDPAQVEVTRPADIGPSRFTTQVCSPTVGCWALLTPAL